MLLLPDSFQFLWRSVLPQAGFRLLRGGVEVPDEVRRGRPQMTAQNSLTQSELWKVPKDYNTKIHGRAVLWRWVATEAWKCLCSGNLRCLFAGCHFPLAIWNYRDE
jgi:hypothetical protein